ncbi:MAG: adenylate kinase [Actinomycetota bacterium]
MMRIVLLGPPGAGKGTQATKLADRHGLAVIGTGDIFRDHVARGTPLGVQAKAYMDRGEYVPDEIAVGMVLDRLEEPDARDGFILDGFPRTVPQAQALERALTEAGRPLHAALNFKIDDEVAVERLTERLVCPNCKRLYNLSSKPPRVEGICDACGQQLQLRSDDDEVTIRRRLEIYREQTEPLVQHFRERGLLRDIDAEASEEVVADRTMEAVSDLTDLEA